MKKLFPLILIAVLAFGCENEEPPLTDDELKSKDLLERAIRDYHFKVFFTMNVHEQESSDPVIDTLFKVVESEALNFALNTEERGLSVILSYDKDHCYNCSEEYYFPYSDMENIIISHENINRPNSLSLVLKWSFREY